METQELARKASLQKSGSLTLAPTSNSVSSQDRSSSCLALRRASSVSLAPTALSSSSPLYQSQPAFEDPALTRSYAACIRLCLDDRLFHGPDYRKFVLQCMFADISAQRANKVRDGPIDSKVIRDLRQCAASISPQTNVVDVLQSLGAAHLFPNLVAYLQGTNVPLPNNNGGGGSSSGKSGSDYLEFINTLNQVMMMATQLHNDALDSRNHKYSAHQIALLYQTLNLLRSGTKPLRRRIEERFDEVKAITENTASPYLGAELQHWLQQITWDCRCMLVECPPFMHEKICSITDLLYR
mmetsp:Transcript_11680/g.33072  ORF Transcript_11680/g.33072 Transcript_11680/m.33072 type:complete len:297 (-) Transcript_11680:585-1475(-)